MPTDSFESPLTLAACGGHVELAMLLLERGANIEEVNDEGYTPLMEAAREGMLRAVNDSFYIAKKSNKLEYDVKAIRKASFFVQLVSRYNYFIKPLAKYHQLLWMED